MEKKPETPQRIVRRRYEDKHKDERKAAHAVWGTSMNRAGWLALEEQYRNKP